MFPVCLLLVFPHVHVCLLLIFSCLTCLDAPDLFICFLSACCSLFSYVYCLLFSKCHTCPLCMLLVVHTYPAWQLLVFHVLHVCLLLMCSYFSCLSIIVCFMCFLYACCCFSICSMLACCCSQILSSPPAVRFSDVS